MFGVGSALVEATWVGDQVDRNPQAKRNHDVAAGAGSVIVVADADTSALKWERTETQRIAVASFEIVPRKSWVPGYSCPSDPSDS